ncbi:MAG: hypothetical protein MUC82_05205 [Cypionkella sp.]|jgi:hypothetical protein|nr:hypothetical protein [Cypionkella sp.]
MRISLVFGLVSLSVLAACGGGAGSQVRGDDDHVEVCQEQSDLARLGKVPTGEIAISCPDHGIGDYGR